MELVIGFILLIIAFIVASFFVKRKYYTNIDRLEAWKIEVMNRPVLDEVGKIKQLNMAGQAEEYFEQWRKTWDAIVTVDLPNVEEWLYDAEDFVGKFRFSKAKDIFETIEDTLQKSEDKINEMVSKLNEIITSDEKNREEYIDLQEQYKNSKRNLLAHHHTYGQAAQKLEVILGDKNDRFAEFEEETNNGNYLKAREIIIQLTEELLTIQEKMETIPLLLNDCHQIPNQFKELRDGIEGMKKEGYNLEHLGIEKELDRLEKQLATYEEQIESAEISEAVTGIEDIKEQLDLLYDLLEKEVSAKKFVHDNTHPIKQNITTLESKNIQLFEVVDTIKLSYHLNESDEKLLEEMDKRIKSIKQTHSVLINHTEDQTSAFSAIMDKFNDIIEEVKQLEQEQKNFTEMIQTLRKDEMEAREKIQEIKNRLQETTRIVTRSNVPGIPLSIEARFLDSGETLQDCFRYLEQVPLSMPAVRESLHKAEESVEKLHIEVVEMIENVFLIERIIQYGNRYRKNYPSIHEKLKLAEDAFRRLDYPTALEEAAAAVESIEPGSLKRLESMINEDIKQTIQ